MMAEFAAMLAVTAVTTALGFAGRHQSIAQGGADESAITAIAGTELRRMIRDDR
jgi:hypothetical protein